MTDDPAPTQPGVEQPQKNEAEADDGMKAARGLYEAGSKGAGAFTTPGESAAFEAGYCAALASEGDVGPEPTEADCGTCDGTGVYREPVPGVEQELESACPECTPEKEALSRALDAFVEAFGRDITWREVLPIVAKASGLEREYAQCPVCLGAGDLFNGGWKRKRCEKCDGTGRTDFRGYALTATHSTPTEGD